MDEKTLQEQHPGLYSAVFNKGKAEGKSEAETKAAEAAAAEKDRIDAHLEAGEQSGNMKLAVESIRKGDKMTQVLSTKYMMSGMRRNSVEARASDDAAAAAATEAPAGGKESKTKKELVAEAVERAHKGEAATA